jgi:hypothetical protein
VYKGNYWSMLVLLNVGLKVYSFYWFQSDDDFTEEIQDEDSQNEGEGGQENLEAEGEGGQENLEAEEASGDENAQSAARRRKPRKE